MKGAEVFEHTEWRWKWMQLNALSASVEDWLVHGTAYDEARKAALPT